LRIESILICSTCVTFQLMKWLLSGTLVQTHCKFQFLQITQRYKWTFDRENLAKITDVVIYNLHVSTRLARRNVFREKKNIFQDIKLNSGSFLTTEIPSLNRLWRRYEFLRFSPFEPSDSASISESARTLRRRYLPLIYPFNRYMHVYMYIYMYTYYKYVCVQT